MVVLIVIFALVGAAFMFVALVIVGTLREAPLSALDPTPPTPLARFARSVLGVHVRRPEQPTATLIPSARR